MVLVSGISMILSDDTEKPSVKMNNKLTSLLVDAVRLSGILGHGHMYSVDKIRPDGGLEYKREWE